MATLTNEQIEAKKQQLKKLAEEAKKLKNELVEAGAWPIDENELDKVDGGYPQVSPVLDPYKTIV